MSDKYKIKSSDYPLKLINLPSNLEKELLDCGYDGIEGLFGAMVGSPDIFKTMLESYGLDYNRVRADICDVLPPGVVESIESAPHKDYPLGVIDPKSQDKN